MTAVIVALRNSSDKGMMDRNTKRSVGRLKGASRQEIAESVKKGSVFDGSVNRSERQYGWDGSSRMHSYVRETIPPLSSKRVQGEAAASRADCWQHVGLSGVIRMASSLLSPHVDRPF